MSKCTIIGQTGTHVGTQENVVEAIGPQSLADMPEERQRKIEGLLRKNESDDEDNDPSHFCSCQRLAKSTAGGEVDEPNGSVSLLFQRHTIRVL